MNKQILLLALASTIGYTNMIISAEFKSIDRQFTASDLLYLLPTTQELETKFDILDKKLAIAESETERSGIMSTINRVQMQYAFIQLNPADQEKVLTAEKAMQAYKIAQEDVSKAVAVQAALPRTASRTAINNANATVTKAMNNASNIYNKLMQNSAVKNALATLNKNRK